MTTKPKFSGSTRVWHQVCGVCSNCMKKNPLKQGFLTINSAGIGAVTPKMRRKRAVALALLDGRSAGEVLPADREQARRELTGGPDMDPKIQILESAPESERWDPVPGSTGHKVPLVASEDEDAEGRSDGERLFDQGIGEAVLDRTRAALKMDL